MDQGYSAFAGNVEGSVRSGGPDILDHTLLEHRGITCCQDLAHVPRQVVPFRAFSGASLLRSYAVVAEKFPLVPPWVILLQPLAETWPSDRRPSPAKGGVVLRFLQVVNALVARALQLPTSCLDAALIRRTV